MRPTLIGPPTKMPTSAAMRSTRAATLNSQTVTFATHAAASTQGRITGPP